MESWETVTMPPDDTSRKLIAKVHFELDERMGTVGEYYRREMKRMIDGHGGCTYCSQAFDTDVSTDAKYPYISPTCRCTLCRECIDVCMSQIVDTKQYTVGCPLCRQEKAWNTRRLVPNKLLANLLHDMKRVYSDEGKDECHGGVEE